MEQIQAIFWIYKTCLIRTVELVRSNLGIIFAPIAYGVVLSVAAMVLVPLGFIGGMVLGVVFAACASSALYLIENVVRMSKATLQDFARGFTVYIWDILTLAFIFWIPMRLLAQFAFTTPEWSIALSGSPDSFVRNLQRGSRTDLSGPCVGIGAVVGELPIHRGELD